MNLNPPEVLERLRTSDSVPSPAFVQHALILASCKTTGLPVVFYKLREGVETIPDATGTEGYEDREKYVCVGDAPNDSFYEDGTIFVGPEDARNRQAGLWHELCHAMVAAKENKLDFPNYDADTDEEVLTCQIEFWLGFASGFYSYSILTKLIEWYSFDEEPIQKTSLYRDTEVLPSQWMVPQSVLQLLIQCREASLKVPLALAVAKELGIESESVLQRRMKTPISRYSKKDLAAPCE